MNHTKCHFCDARANFVQTVFRLQDGTYKARLEPDDVGDELRVAVCVGHLKMVRLLTTIPPRLPPPTTMSLSASLA